MDTSKMKKVTVAWLAENDDTGWRSNALRTDLPRAFINVGTLGEAWFEVASVHDPLPSWTVGADGLYTVFLTDESLDSLALEGDYPVWLDKSDLQPIDVTAWVDALESATPAAPAPAAIHHQPAYEALVLDAMIDGDDDDYLDHKIFDDDASYEWDEPLAHDEDAPDASPSVTVPAKDALMSLNDDGELQITFPVVEGYEWADVFKAYIGQRVSVRLSFVVGNFASESEAG